MSALVVSLDFELHWGVRDHSSVEDYQEHLEGVRHAIPALLALFARREIHASWATVGLLMTQGRGDAESSRPRVLPRYQNPRFSPFEPSEWSQLGDHEGDDPFHFAPSLLEAIQRTPHQEVASHTFSHFYCLEEGATPEAFTADLSAAVKVARRRGIQLKSIVFPRNQVSPEHLEVCRNLGFAAYRGTQAGWMHRAADGAGQTLSRRALRLADSYLPLSGQAPVARARGLVNVPASAFLRPWTPRLRPLDGLRLKRIGTALRAAAKAGHPFHLWWHPHNFGRYTGENLEFLVKVLDLFDREREKGMASLNMGEVAERLEAAA